MSYSYLIPSWFFGFDVGMEVLFAIITFFIALTSFNIYRMTDERRIKFFSIAFFMICLSYLVLGGLNLWFAHIASEGFREVSITDAQTAGMFLIYVYMFLSITGLVTLTYVKADMKKGKTFYLLFGLSLLVIAASFDKQITYRILSVFLLSFIAFQFLNDYIKNRRSGEMWTLVAFVMLLLSSFDFIFSPLHYQVYFIGHIFEFLGYLILLFVLIRSIKK